jgi:hypothetical protein
MRHFLVLMAMLVVVLIGLGTASWIHTAFGVILPWQTPKHINVCGRQYREGGLPFIADADTRVLTLRATVFDLPIPLPDLEPTDSGLPYAGCPIQVVLVLRDRQVLYGPPQGGP